MCCWNAFVTFTKKYSVFYNLGYLLSTLLFTIPGYFIAQILNHEFKYIEGDVMENKAFIVDGGIKIAKFEPYWFTGFFFLLPIIYSIFFFNNKNTVTRVLFVVVVGVCFTCSVGFGTYIVNAIFTWNDMHMAVTTYHCIWAMHDGGEMNCGCLSDEFHKAKIMTKNCDELATVRPYLIVALSGCIVASFAGVIKIQDLLRSFFKKDHSCPSFKATPSAPPAPTLEAPSCSTPSTAGSAASTTVKKEERYELSSLSEEEETSPCPVKNASSDEVKIQMEVEPIYDQVEV